MLWVLKKCNPINSARCLFICFFAILPNLMWADLSEPVKEFVSFGDRCQIALPSVGAALAFFASDNDSLAELGTSLSTAVAIAHILKRTIHATRPNGSSQSFPSGHAAASFVGATFIYKKFGPALGIPAIGLASLVGASRVIGKHHHLHDVIAGAGFGLLMSHLFITPPSKKTQLFSQNYVTENDYLFRLSIKY